MYHGQLYRLAEINDAALLKLDTKNWKFPLASEYTRLLRFVVDKLTAEFGEVCKKIIFFGIVFFFFFDIYFIFFPSL